MGDGGMMPDISATELLFSNFDGDPVDDPEEVITDAFDDSRYRARIAPLIELLNDPNQDAYHRFLACCALASWAEPVGYHAIVDAVRQSGQVAWYAELLDSRFSVDETFAQLAAAVYRSERMA